MEKRELERLSKRLTKFSGDIPNLKNLIKNYPRQVSVASVVTKEKKSILTVMANVIFLLLIFGAGATVGYFSVLPPAVKITEPENPNIKTDSAIELVADRCWKICLDNTSPPDGLTASRNFFEMTLKESENSYMRMNLSCECFPI